MLPKRFALITLHLRRTSAHCFTQENKSNDRNFRYCTVFMVDSTEIMGTSRPSQNLPNSTSNVATYSINLIYRHLIIVLETNESVIVGPILLCFLSC